MADEGSEIRRRKVKIHKLTRRQTSRKPSTSGTIKIIHGAVKKQDNNEGCNYKLIQATKNPQDKDCEGDSPQEMIYKTNGMKRCKILKNVEETKELTKDKKTVQYDLEGTIVSDTVSESVCSFGQRKESISSHSMESAYNDKASDPKYVAEASNGHFYVNSVEFHNEDGKCLRSDEIKNGSCQGGRVIQQPFSNDKIEAYAKDAQNYENDELESNDMIQEDICDNSENVCVKTKNLDFKKESSKIFWETVGTFGAVMLNDHSYFKVLEDTPPQKDVLEDIENKVSKSSLVVTSVSTDTRTKGRGPIKSTESEQKSQKNVSDVTPESIDTRSKEKKSCNVITQTTKGKSVTKKQVKNVGKKKKKSVKLSDEKLMDNLLEKAFSVDEQSSNELKIKINELIKEDKLPDIDYNNEDPFECPLCHTMGKNHRWFYRHVVLCHNTLFSCTVCGVEFKTRYAAFEHVAVVHLNINIEKDPGKEKKGMYSEYIREEKLPAIDHITESPCKCPVCHMKIRKNRELATHMKIHAIEKPFSCTICSVTYRSRGAVAHHVGKVHMNMTTKKPPIICKVCNASFINLRHRRKHQVEEHGKINEDICKICSVQFYSSYDLRVHNIRHHEKRERVACEICGKTYKAKRYLQRHIEAHHSLTKKVSKEYTCEQCDKVFLKYQGFYKHMKTKHGNNEFLCHLCSKAFSMKWQLSQHLKRHAKEQRKYPCHLCDKVFASYVGRWTHKKNKHEGVRVHCHICNKGFPNKAALTYHLAIHSDARPYSCKICLKTFKRKADLKCHAKVHSLLTFNCNFCKMYFRSKDKLDSHVDRFHNNKKQDQRVKKKLRKRCHPCEECAETFVSMLGLKKHKKLVHNISKTCEECDKTFQSNTGLNRHKKLAHGRFLCHICSEEFSLKVMLVRHLKSHTETTPVTCGACGKVFTSKQSLYYHRKLVHTSGKQESMTPKMCETCGRSFTRLDSFKKHQRIHTGHKNYFCSVCGRGFLVKYNLNVHMNIHTGVRPYQCTQCGKCFTQHSTLTKHIKVMHQQL